MKTDVLTTDYHCAIRADISAEDAMAKIANVSGWWANNFEGSASQLNDVFIVRFGETFVRFRISELVPGKKIVWLVEDCNLHWISDKKEWKGTEVVWEISAQDGLTRVDMTHVGLAPGAECYASCKPGWDGHIKNSLLQLFVEGKGMPEGE